MRDSIGGTLLFWIVLILLSVFIVFIAVIIKYAHVYKIKNSMVDYIEKNEGITTRENFETQLLALNYPKENGYKICRYLSSDKSKGGYYYIELYTVMKFPIVSNFAVVNITIRGETRNITTGTKIRSTDLGWFTGVVSECKSCNIGSGNCASIEA